MHATTFFAAVIVSLSVSALVVAPASEAQQAATLFRVGFLLPLSLSDLRGQRFLLTFRQGLRELGYVEGQNIAIELRSAEDSMTGRPASRPTLGCARVVSTSSRLRGEPEGEAAR